MISGNQNSSELTSLTDVGKTETDKKVADVVEPV
jgi:hypothetical protein